MRAQKAIYNCLIVFISLTLSVSCSKSDSGSSGAQKPSVVTTDITNITGVNVTLGGNITSNGGGEITEYGICWSKNPNPTIMDKVSSVGASLLGSYQMTINTEEPNTVYYVRAFAQNTIGVSYGNQLTFTTQSNIITKTPTDILSTSAVLRLSILSSPGIEFSEIGFSISTSPNPSTNPYTQTYDINGDTYLYSISGLTRNTTYYAKAYYRDSQNRVFTGEEFSFKTCGYYGASSGFVFYDKGEYSDGWRYMELAPAMLNYNTSEVGCAWGCNNTLLAYTYSDFNQGYQNTQHIISTCSASECAARMCDNYSVNGLSDWFLPSVDELKVVYKSLRKENIISTDYNYLWSSTEFDMTHAYMVAFYSTGATVNSQLKNWKSSVAPIRRF